MLQLKKRIKNFILDFVFVVIALFILLIVRLFLFSVCEYMYLLLCSAFMFYLGLKHYKRQFYTTFLFFLGVFVLNMFFDSQDIYFYALYLILTSMLSLIAYFFPLKHRKDHQKLNTHFVEIKKDYKLAVEETNKAIQKIDFYNRNIDIIFNIYNLSRKMIITVETSDILGLCVEFFEKSFPANDFFIFDYDVIHNRYTTLFSSERITENLLFKFSIFFRNSFKNKFFETTEVKPILLNKETLQNHNMYDFLDDSVKYVLFVPIIKKDSLIQLSVILFRDERFVTYLNLKYFDIFYKQMSLGVLKIKVYTEIKDKSIKDGLTDLYRRTFFEEKFDYEVKRSIRENTKIAILMIDIDFFKQYNDKYGHLLGDKVLIHISEILKKSVYETDIVARYGGEEFLVLMPRADRQKAIAKAEKICSEIEKTKFVEDIDESITVSIGISCFPEDGETKQTLIDKADKALYFAKNNGRNRVVDYLEVERVLR